MKIVIKTKDNEISYQHEEVVGLKYNSTEIFELIKVITTQINNIK